MLWCVMILLWHCSIISSWVHVQPFDSVLAFNKSLPISSLSICLYCWLFAFWDFHIICSLNVPMDWLDPDSSPYLDIYLLNSEVLWKWTKRAFPRNKQLSLKNIFSFIFRFKFSSTLRTAVINYVISQKTHVSCMIAFIF